MQIYRRAPAPRTAPTSAHARKPTGLAATVQTSVLYHGNEWLGVTEIVPKNWTGIGVVSPRVRFERRNSVKPCHCANHPSDHVRVNRSPRAFGFTSRSPSTSRVCDPLPSLSH